MIDATNDEIKKALITISVEQALLEIGKPVLDNVEHALYHNYNCYIPDCFDHPEYLKAIIKDLYGNSYSNIIKSIHKYLDKFASQKPIEEFLIAI